MYAHGTHFWRCCNHRLLSDALAMNLADIAALNLIYRSGVDLSGHPVIVFIAAHVPAPKVDLRRVLMYIVRVRLLSSPSREQCWPAPRLPLASHRVAWQA